MFKTTRGITVLVVAFVLTLAALRYINRERPTVAFEQEYTIGYKRFQAYRFKATWPTRLVFIVESKGDVPFDVFLATKEEFQYYDLVDRGKIPRTRPFEFRWQSPAAASHRSDPVPISPGSYVLNIRNALPENTEKLPIEVTIRGEDLLTPE